MSRSSGDNRIGEMQLAVEAQCLECFACKSSDFALTADVLRDFSHGFAETLVCAANPLRVSDGGEEIR